MGDQTVLHKDCEDLFRFQTLVRWNAITLAWFNLFEFILSEAFSKDHHLNFYFAMSSAQVFLLIINGKEKSFIAWAAYLEGVPFA